MRRAKLFAVAFVAFLLDTNVAKDFEGQRLAEFLATVLLGAVGVRLHIIDFWI
jgi:hypothetical protein